MEKNTAHNVPHIFSTVTSAQCIVLLITIVVKIQNECTKLYFVTSSC